MSEIIFVNGIKFINVKDTQYGQIIKFAIDKNQILNNEYNDNGLLNVDILKGKSGKWYSKINTYKPTTTQEQPQVDTPEDCPF